MSKYDDVDGGVACTFLDGPKKGHLGVVSMVGQAPPAELTFLGDLVYRRHDRRKIDCLDANGAKVVYRGVTYKVDPQCAFMVRMRFEVDQAVADSKAGKVEIQ